LTIKWTFAKTAGKQMMIYVKNAWREKQLREADLMREMKNQISIQSRGQVPVFRVNVGRAWTGNDIKHTENGGLYISAARPFDSGLPPGFSDIFCVVPVIITPEMVGTTIGTAAFIEVKTATGRVKPEQLNFLQLMENRGCRAGVARSVEQAIEIVLGPS